MSSSGLPYRLRPNKYVDRELFAEFVSVLVSSTTPDRYVYVSMGGNHLSDHVAIYRRSGIRKLYAFDRDPDVVARQAFNAPFEGVRCSVHTSGELPVRLDSILSDFGADNAILWLDYTEPKRLEQLQEIETIVSKLVVGDVLRVTVNADFSKLSKREANLKLEERELPEPKKRAALLKLDLGSYLSSDITQLDYTDMAEALAKSIARACRLGCEAANADIVPVPALITEYRDTTPMLTATVMLTDSNRKAIIPETWRYAPTDWNGIERIKAPDLSPRERYALDQLMHQDAEAVSDALGFTVPADDVASYSKYHRFYPAFQNVND